MKTLAHPEKNIKTKETSNERVRRHRERVRCDATKLEEARDKDRVRKQLERKKKRERARSDKLMNEIRENKRRDVQKYRQKNNISNSWKTKCSHQQQEVLLGKR